MSFGITNKIQLLVLIHFVDSMRFPMYMILLSANEGSFTSSSIYMNFISFFYLIALTVPPVKTLNRRGRVVLGLFLILEGEDVFSFHH